MRQIDLKRTITMVIIIRLTFHILHNIILLFQLHALLKYLLKINMLEQILPHIENLQILLIDNHITHSAITALIKY